MFTPQTAIACVNYSHAYRQLYELTGVSEHSKRVLFGDESTFTLEEIPAMVWAHRGTPARIVGTDGKGRVSVFLFLNGGGEVCHIHGNIGQSQFQLVV